MIGGVEGDRERGREGGRQGEREGGREGGMYNLCIYVISVQDVCQ